MCENNNQDKNGEVIISEINSTHRRVFNVAASNIKPYPEDSKPDNSASPEKTNNKD